MEPMHVLLVEDDRQVAELLRLAIASCGHEPHCESTAEDAVNALAHQQFDVAIVDLRLSRAFQQCDGLVVVDECIRLNVGKVAIITGTPPDEPVMGKIREKGVPLKIKPIRFSWVRDFLSS